ncbi:MAG: alpha-L-fucosidase [Rhodothermaceae bacterium]|nr:MAG: alpha-L-fucosidase [Rhodothermaceae bacterium]
MHRITLWTAGLLLGLFTTACTSGKRPAGEVAGEDPEARRAWFREARFGMFIHWGVYSVLGRGEWVMENERMTVEAYEELPPRFNPTGFDPAAWVRIAKEAGMRYITITAKHHDGFGMWDSAVSDYDIVDRTPYGKDVLKMLADECEKQGLRLFFYYSHLDWHHPDYYPRGKTGRHSARPDSGDFDRYLDYVNAQIAELAGGAYGKVAGFWFDGWWDQRREEGHTGSTETLVDWRLQETYDLIHRLQPQALIANNHHVMPFPGEDIQIFERDLPGRNTTGFNAAGIGRLPLETCETINHSWGYNRDDRNFKSVKELIHYLVRAAGHDANLLLNVGPMPEGTFQPEVVERLRAMGAWLRKHGETIYGTRGGPMAPQAWGVTTRTDRRVFVHVLQSDAPALLTLPGTAGLEVRRAVLFGTGTPVPFTDEGGDVQLQLPSTRDSLDTIVVLEV